MNLRNHSSLHKLFYSLKNLHVDSFKYQSTEDMPNEAYEKWQESHMNAKVFSLEFRNIGQSGEWQEMIVIWGD
ncbi:hypothetical protein WCV21_10630 [Lactobacillus helveticus]|uniref:Uncharacterized protein n=1 Tax=Lactobacillus helveticus TaxID=1587 RepID=A0AAU8XW06_LACHE|nr:hypothetical protein [Lactobacillus helveticus]AUI74865.1 hypothetical protein Lh8105_09020 [Lactobacillus helveticus]PXZ10155.1 hypothetical protein DM470_11620 [Lactobacillus helveticus]PXZ12639.1 hypothetical protein DM471_11415 [Lactobacillus helveticus]PXZ19454.1 hypothetical protein DM468_12105 [Lactobacillus helveticus]PXZ22531.1 hypothetical protein DM472_11975 [Lactobacillus helveticus]